MAAATIDFSIDLGVTNSRIAVARNGLAQVVLNGEGLDSTPTAVWCDERERFIVGSQTRDRLVDDAVNIADRFRTQLGTGEVFRFARQNRPAEPEDLAAEVIGSLRADARRRTGRDVSAAVLTAPTGFTAAQRDALVAAARKAGVAMNLLLQEPVAAALAYGGPAADACWLVYDFGGVGFEAALVTLQDGVLQVTNHAGDPRVGGEVIDWTIVDKLLIPAVAAQFAVTGFRRDNPKWRIAVAKLKVAAEEARIGLDRESSAQILVPFLCRDDSGAPVRFRHVLTRNELDALLEPVAGRSLKVCERLLAKRGVRFDDLERVVVSGGPARDPYFARLLAEQGGGLGKRIASSVDPFTAVVQGAALYAGNEPVERVAPPVFVAGREVTPEPEAEIPEETVAAELVATEEVAEEAEVEAEVEPAEVAEVAAEEAEVVAEAEPEVAEAAAVEERAEVAEEQPEVVVEVAAEEAEVEAEVEPEVAEAAAVEEPAEVAEEQPEVVVEVAAEEADVVAEAEPAVAAAEEAEVVAAVAEEEPEVAPAEEAEAVAEAAQPEPASEVSEAEGRPSWQPEWPAPLSDELQLPDSHGRHLRTLFRPRSGRAPPAPGSVLRGSARRRRVLRRARRSPSTKTLLPKKWRPVSEEAETADAVARADEAEPDREAAPVWALEVEKGESVEAEEAVALEGVGEAWDLVPDEGVLAAGEALQGAEQGEWAPVDRGPLTSAERSAPAAEAPLAEALTPATAVEPVAPAPPVRPLPPRTGAPAGTLEETIVARAGALAKAGRYKDAKRLVDRLGPDGDSLGAGARLAGYDLHPRGPVRCRRARVAAGCRPGPAGHKGEASPRHGTPRKTQGQKSESPLRRAMLRKSQGGARRAGGGKRRRCAAVVARRRGRGCRPDRRHRDPGPGPGRLPVQDVRRGGFQVADGDRLAHGVHISLARRRALGLANGFARGDGRARTQSGRAWCAGEDGG